MSRNLRGLSERKGIRGGLFEELTGAFLSGAADDADGLEAIRERYLTGRSTLAGVGSFYDFLKQEHRSKKVFVCDGTSCLTAGATGKHKKRLLALYGEDEIGTMTCLGHCHSNNAFISGNRTMVLKEDASSHATQALVPALEKIQTGTNVPEPALIGPTGDLHEYYALLRTFCSDIPGAIGQIERSGLRGRGGAGFSFSAKKKASRSVSSARKYIICNADEGDPGAFSDKWLLEERPHAVLFGMMAAGMITGADTGILYIRGEYPEAVETVRKAIEELREEKLTSGSLWRCDRDFVFHVIKGAGAYICGEETSLINSLEGLRPEVRTRPPYPATYGLFGKPTLLSNVETFANVRYILEKGGEAYARLGTDRSPGTKLVSLDGGFRNPGLYEVRMGTPLREVFEDMGGGTRYPVKAYQVGGPLGGIVPSHMVNELTLDFESFAANGFLLGHAGVVTVPDGFPLAELLLHLFDFTSRESCGKCFPCRLGARRGKELLEGSVGRGGKIERELFNDLLDTLQYGSLCALGGGLPLPVRNVLKYFPEETGEIFN